MLMLFSGFLSRSIKKSRIYWGFLEWFFRECFILLEQY